MRNFAFLVDAAGTQTISDVARADPSRFHPLLGGHLSQGYTHAAHWVRFDIDAPAGRWILDILPPFLNDLRVYVPDTHQSGGFLEVRAGNLLPYSAREIGYRGFAFGFDKTDTDPVTIFVRVATTSSTVMVPRVWSPKAFEAMETREAVLLSASLALLVTLMILNFLNWIWFREPLLLWFSAYIGSLALSTATGVSGFASQYVFAEQPIFADAMVKISALLAIAFGSAFYRRLFGIDGSQPLLYRCYQAGFWLPLAMIVPSVSGYYIHLGPPILEMALLLTSSNLVLAVLFWRRRAVAANLMLIANLISGAGVASMILNLLGVINGGFPALYSMQIAGLGTAFALHLALGDRFRALLAERHQAFVEAAREKQMREQQSSFFAMMSHELKTPLAMIDSAAQVLQDVTPPTTATTRRFARIRDAVGRINDLMDRTLQYDRLSQNMPPFAEPARRPLRLAALLHEVMAGFPDAALRLRFEHGPCREVAGDPALLKLIFSNLIDNALKYSPEESPVVVSLSCTSDRAVVAVRDHGPGISPEERETVFARYVRGTTIGDIPGTGLGLYVARQIAEQHCGAVEIRDPDDGGQGTLARVRLPFWSSAA